MQNGSVEFTVSHLMGLSEWKDHVLGSGAWSYGSWWVDYSEDGDGVNAVWYTDVDRNDDKASGYMTYQELADVASDLASQGWEIINRAIAEDDFDAIAMDVVLQKAFIGEVRYG